MLDQSFFPGAPAEIAARIGQLPEDVMAEILQGADPAGVALARR